MIGIVKLFKSYSIIMGAFLLLLFSCKQEISNTTAIPMGYEYFPVNIGHTIVYNFDSIFVDAKVAQYDTFHLQIKDYTESNFFDNRNRISQRIERYIRATDTSAWEIKNVYYTTLTKTTAEKVEDNQRYLVLIFPVKLNKIWKGNSMNRLRDWDYEYTQLDESFTIGTTKFDSTLTVTHIDELNLIEKNYSVETYAKHIGLIYKQYIQIEKTPAGVVNKAVSYTYKLESYTP